MPLDVFLGFFAGLLIGATAHEFTSNALARSERPAPSAPDEINSK